MKRWDTLSHQIVNKFEARFGLDESPAGSSIFSPPDSRSIPSLIALDIA